MGLFGGAVWKRYCVRLVFGFVGWLFRTVVGWLRGRVAGWNCWVGRLVRFLFLLVRAVGRGFS